MSQSGRSPPLRPRVSHMLAVFGPGLVVMLADTDVGSIVTAGQSGVHWGYRLLPLQFLLIPILYMVQELTVRLAIFTGRGHGELIRDTFGPAVAWLSAGGLAIAAGGTLLTEFSGIAGVGELYGVSRLVTLPVAAMALIAIVLTGSYRRVERVAIAIGLFELAFFFVAWSAKPHLGAIARDAIRVPLSEPDYLYLVAANIGAIVMPWMIFYQQSAIADKKLGPEHLTAARWDTAIGAILTQSVMAAVLIAAAATIGAAGPQTSLATVGQMSEAMTSLLGPEVGRLVFGVGVVGAALVAAIVASLALAWGLAEVAGFRRPPERRRGQARWFHAVYAVCVAGGAAVVAEASDLVSLSLGVQVLNALMLPLVLAILIALAIRTLPPSHRLRGWYLWLVVSVAGITCALGVFGGIGSLWR